MEALHSVLINQTRHQWPCTGGFCSLEVSVSLLSLSFVLLRLPPVSLLTHHSVFSSCVCVCVCVCVCPFSLLTHHSVFSSCVCVCPFSLLTHHSVFSSCVCPFSLLTHHCVQLM